jgi:hypothetical protein
VGQHGIYVTHPKNFLTALQKAYKTAQGTSMLMLINVQARRNSGCTRIILGASSARSNRA